MVLEEIGTFSENAAATEVIGLYVLQAPNPQTGPIPREMQQRLKATVLTGEEVCDLRAGARDRSGR